MKRLFAKTLVLVMMAAATFTMTVHTSEADAQAASKGQKVVNYAKKFVGNKYKYGGSSLTRGTDCSGFTMSVYRKFGKRLPHSSSGQRSVGKKVKGGLKNAKPGDIICYSGHVAIYIGNNMLAILLHIQEVELKFQIMQDTERLLQSEEFFNKKIKNETL